MRKAAGLILDWDPGKAEANLAKHGVPFEAAERFEWAGALLRRDDRRDYGEARWQAIGLLDGRLHHLTFTRRGDRVRLISLRRAHSRELRRYERDQA
jgi:hypothetical protein